MSSNGTLRIRKRNAVETLPLAAWRPQCANVLHTYAASLLSLVTCARCRQPRTSQHRPWHSSASGRTPESIARSRNFPAQAHNVVGLASIPRSQSIAIERLRLVCPARSRQVQTNVLCEISKSNVTIERLRLVCSARFRQVHSNILCEVSEKMPAPALPRLAPMRKIGARQASGKDM